MIDLDLPRLLQSVIRVEVELFDAVDARLRHDAGMMLIELLPLRVIAETAGCRVQDYADAVAISVGGASKSVDRLERRGWVRRIRHPVDRRSSIIELTAEGHDARTRGNDTAGEVMREQLSRLSPVNLARLDELMRDLDPTR